MAIYKNGKPTTLQNIFDARDGAGNTMCYTDDLGRPYSAIISDWLNLGRTYYYIDGAPVQFELKAGGDA